MSVDYSSKVHRLLRLITLMQQGRAGNARTLATELGVTERTVYRDLEVLSAIGVPYFFDDANSEYCIRKDFFLPPVQLTAIETIALMSLASGIGADDQIALTRPAAQAMEKIRAQLPRAILEELGDLDQHIDVRLPPGGPDGAAIRDVYGLVQEAIRERRKLRCEYESLNPNSDNGPFELHPYRLVFDQRAWYVIGFHEGRGEVRTLKLNRFTSIQSTECPYAIPDGFSLKDYHGKAWRMIRGDQTYKVAIHFEAGVAETVSDTNWHPTQQIDDHEDGSITFRCEVDGLDEIVWWVLSYGPHARVHEPKELAEKVVSLARQTAEKYPDDD